ncbi:hypothetical protein [Methylobacter sp.]|uniref:hypothetical protein n=1 Tax=Methylobacter sp. TaxID=2051955 RepID=UPI003DA4E3B4
MRNRRHVMNCLTVLNQQIKCAYREGAPTPTEQFIAILDDVQMLASGELSKQALKDHDVLSVAAISKRIRGQA